ncbi:hypothetical protein ACIP9H_29785 [Streptomyces sp. NPDC088732]|uniref:hypothetical protein n=1 Tax=Streptomyces sp. NPDC088732 TaxID=3365879 RepID=UPI00381A52E2
MSQDTPVPEQAPPAPETPPEAAAEPLPAARPPRRRGRTTLLILAAAVLGVAAGAGTGYKIQYDRPETPLPPLAQPALVQPKGAAPETKPLTAAEDTLVKYDGDLRKLLLKRPKGAKDWVGGDPGHDQWLSLYDYAETFEEPKSAFAEFNRYGFRRVAVAAWRTGTYDTSSSTEIRLVQFRDESTVYTEEHFEAQQGYASEERYAGNKGSAIPGAFDGRVWVYSKPETKAGYLPVYKARALARKGTIMLDIWVTSARPIKKSTIMSLAERQWERL